VKPSIEQIVNQLALKREGRPEEGYWQDFLCEFHHRQRKQAVTGSRYSAMISQFSSWFGSLGPSKWAYGTGVAYAALTVGFILTPRSVERENLPSSPVKYQVVPAPGLPLEQLDRLDLSPSTQGNIGEQIF